ncbi:MAG: hypothetical protein JOZ96_24230 [Acidobacteria bacterium]|nr:hypothetical protein [Acidobacteriota bacterium]
MGWFESTKYPGVMLGDDAFDETYNFFKNLSEAYRKEFGRGPSLDEVRVLLETSLRVSGGGLLADLDEKEVSQVAIKTAKKRKDQTYAAGDLFAIPLGAGRLVLGRVMDIHKTRGVLIEVFREVTRSVDEPPDLSKAERLFHPIYTWGKALKTGRWKVVGSEPEYKMSNADASLKFAMGDDDIGWQIVNVKGSLRREASSKEVKGIEPLEVWFPENVERRVGEELRRTAQKPLKRR